MFVDRASIIIRAGNGGHGAVSFRRMKYEPKGGPDGGNGGDGGDVILQAESGMTTLYDFKFQRIWAAQDGDKGGRKQCSGLRGKDLILRLPPGTMLYDEATGALVHDLQPGEKLIIAKGGRGGFGNEHFKRSDYQSPKMSEAGHAGQQLAVRLELKVIAEVGLVGLPNAGKSTLLAALTKATPKIANYPFTTLAPQLGVCEVDSKRRLVLADIPGLIEGASDGAGLGHDFLRHVERTKTIVHMLDCMPDNGLPPAKNYEAIRAELAAFSQKIADKPELVVVTKLDLLETAQLRDAAVKQVARDLGLRYGKDIIGISSATREGLKELMEHLWKFVHPAGNTRADVGSMHDDSTPLAQRNWKPLVDTNAPLPVKTPQAHVQPVQSPVRGNADGKRHHPATPVLMAEPPTPTSKPAPAQRATKKRVAQKARSNATKDAAAKAPKKLAKKAAKKTTTKTNKKPGKKPGKKANKKLSKKPSKKAAKRPSTKARRT